MRLHAVTWPTGASVTVSAQMDAPTPEDTQDFTATIGGASVTFTQGSDTAPAVKMFAITAPFGGYIRIYIKGTLAASTGTFQPTISVDVAGKS